MRKYKKFIIDLDYPIVQLNKFTADKSEHQINDELFIICGDDCTENFPYVPSQNIRIYGQGILKLRDFLNEHYPKD